MKKDIPELTGDIIPEHEAREIRRQDIAALDALVATFDKAEREIASRQHQLPRRKASGKLWLYLWLRD